MPYFQLSFFIGRKKLFTFSNFIFFKLHKMNQNFYILLTILLIVLLTVIFWCYYTYSKEISLNLVYKSLKFNKELEENTITQMIQDPVILNNNQSLMLFCEIPNNYLYWGIIGLIFDEDSGTYQSIGEPVSIADYCSMSHGNKLAVLLVPNKSMFDQIKFSFSKEFQEKSRSNLKIVPIFVEPGKKYSFMCNTILNNKMEKHPIYKSRIYTSSNVIFSNEKEDNVLKSELCLFNSNCRKVEYDFDKWSIKSEEIIHDEIIYGFPGEDKNNLDIFLPNSIKKGYVYDINSDTILEFINRDVLYFACDLNLEIDEKIIIVALDHSMTNKCIYSDITFSDQSGVYYSYVTGNSKNNKTNLKNKIICRVIYPPNKKGKIRIIEKLYVNYDSKTRPDKNLICPMNVFIVKK